MCLLVALHSALLSPERWLTKRNPLVQILLEFYALYPDAQKPSFEVTAAPGSVPTNPQFKATVVCPQVQRSPDDVAFEDLVFEVRGLAGRVILYCLVLK